MLGLEHRPPRFHSNDGRLGGAQFSHTPECPLHEKNRSWKHHPLRILQNEVRETTTPDCQPSAAGEEHLAWETDDGDGDAESPAWKDHLSALPGEVGRPVVRQVAAALGRSTRRSPPFGYFTTCARAASMTSRGWFVRSEAQSQKLDRKPCGMAAMPCSLTSFESVMSESAFPRRLGNTSPPPSLRSPASCRISPAPRHP